MNPPSRSIVYLTAGAAGMFCGSCMHDNAVVRAMRARGEDVLLQPVYTPIRTDELDVAERNVFFGGIHVYLLQKAPWLSRLPRWTRAWLDWPALIQLATRRAVSTDPGDLGQLTLSMLRGQHGNQADEIERLIRWFEEGVRPSAVIYSNLLIGGVIPTVRKRLPDTRQIVMLQGDDIFLDHLPESIRRDAIAMCGQLGRDVDAFVTHSHFYADKMAAMLGLDRSRFHVQPLTIDLTPFNRLNDDVKPLSKAKDEFRIGYFARIAPEKGLHLLADAFANVAAQPDCRHVTLHAGGWLGAHNHAYVAKIKDRLKAEGLGDRFVVHDSPDLNGKINLLRSFDVMSVPSPYADPKGLFVLESWAAGVPVIQPRHGAFPELIEEGRGGWLFPPGNVESLADRILHLVRDRDELAVAMQPMQEHLAAHHEIAIAARHMSELCRPSGSTSQL